MEICYWHHCICQKGHMWFIGWNVDIFGSIRWSRGLSMECRGSKFGLLQVGRHLNSWFGSGTRSFRFTWGWLPHTSNSRRGIGNYHRYSSTSPKGQAIDTLFQCSDIFRLVTKRTPWSWCNVGLFGIGIGDLTIFFYKSLVLTDFFWTQSSQPSFAFTVVTCVHMIRVTSDLLLLGEIDNKI